MSHATDIRIVDVEPTIERIAYRTPMKFGGRVVEDATLLNLRATVETRTGRRGVGHGSMPLGNAWAWPSASLAPGETLKAMSDLGLKMVEAARATALFAHPLELTHALSQEHDRLTRELTARLALAEPPPRLAQLVAASPLEAALYDAYGKALGENVYNLLGREFVSTDLSHYLGAEFVGQYLDRYTLREPVARLPLYHLVGALDPLSPADAQTPVGDGLPEDLGAWIVRDGLTHLKIKLAGDDLAWDISRVEAVERVAAETQQRLGRRAWHYSLDFNERCANVDYVLEFLAGLGQRSSAALARVQYIEQPTHRDLKRFPENRMHAAARIKPVVIDESLVDLESLLLAREQGYTGVALKACKGQSEALLMGAAAQYYGLFLCVQDLTCPGASFLQSASLAARIPTIAAIEGNGRQYCPAGNARWSDRFPTLFSPRNGLVETGLLTGPGLGY